MEQMSRELRYLDEFDLHSAAYNEDQISRCFRGNGINQKGILDWVQNPQLASPTLKLLARIFSQEKNIGYRDFEKALHKIPKAKLVSCNFGQFFGNGNLAEEKSVILIIDCYSRKQSNNMQRNKNNDMPINVFTKDDDYQYFVEIYQKWKERRERTIGVLDPSEKSKQLQQTSISRPLRKNESFNSFSSVGNQNKIPKNRSGFFGQKSNSILDVSQRSSYQSDCQSPTLSQKDKRNRLGGRSSQFKVNDEIKISSGSSSEDGSSSSSSDSDYFGNDDENDEEQVDPEVDKISVGDLDDSVDGSKNKTTSQGDHSHKAADISNDGSHGGLNLASIRKLKQRTPLKKPSKKIDLRTIQAMINPPLSQFEGRIRSTSANDNLVSEAKNRNSINKENDANNQDDSEAQLTGQDSQDQDDLSPKPGQVTRKKTQEIQTQDFGAECLAQEDPFNRLQVPDFTSSQNSHRSLKQELQAPNELDQQMMSWISDYNQRQSVIFEELLYQSPQFMLGQMATVLLKKNKPKSLLMRGGGSDSKDDGINLTNLVGYLESILSKEMVDVQGIQLRLIQSFSKNQKIIEVLTHSADATSSKSLSAQNLTGAAGGNFSQTPAISMRPRLNNPIKTRKKVKHRFLLSYLSNDQEVFVSLFLINDRANCINTDIVLILSQKLAPVDHFKSLYIVPEANEDQLQDQYPSPEDYRKQIAQMKSNQAQQNKLFFPVQPQPDEEDDPSGYEDLFKSRRMAAMKQNQMMGQFSTLAASEIQKEIVKPQKTSNSQTGGGTGSNRNSTQIGISGTTTAQHTSFSSAACQQKSANQSSDPNQAKANFAAALGATAGIRPKNIASPSNTSTTQQNTPPKPGTVADSMPLLPACSGDITMKVQVKYHKNFLKLLKQILQTAVLEHRLY